MKKKQIFVLEFIALLIVLLVGGCSNSKNTQIELKARDRDEVYTRSFEEWVSTVDQVEYHIEKSEDIGKEEAKEIITQIEEQRKAMAEYIPFETEDTIDIYIVESDIFDVGVKTETYSFETTVVTYFEEVETGEYLGEYVYVLSNAPQKWMAYGLASLLLDSKPDEEKVSEALASEEDIKKLHLSDVWFVRGIPNEEVDEAIAVAESFFQYMVDTKGKNFITEIFEASEGQGLLEDKQSYLKFIGSEYPYDVREDEEEAYNLIKANYIVKFLFKNMSRNDLSEGSYNLYGKIPNADFYIKVNSQMEMGYINCPANTEEMMKSTYLGIGEARDYLTKNSENLFDINQYMTYYVLDYTLQSAGSSDHINNEVFLYDPLGTKTGCTHEAIHCYTLDDSTEYSIEKEWLIEGFTTYVEANCEGNENHLFTDGIDFDEVARACIDSETKKIKADAQTISAGYGSPYYLYCSWIDYLVEEYGFQNVAEVIDSGCDLEGVMGKSYDELIDEWITKKLLNE